MTTYSAITSGQIDAESYIDTNLAGQWTNNVLAMFEGDASASGVRLQLAALEASITPWVEIETQTASSSATIDFITGIDSTYTEYMVTLTEVVGATANTKLYLRYTHSVGASPITWETTLYTWKVASSGAATSSASAAQIELTSANVLHTDTGASLSGTVRLYNPADSTSYTLIEGQLGGRGVIGGTPSVMIMAGTRVAASVVQGLRFYASSGNITSGKFTLYGLR